MHLSVKGEKRGEKEISRDQEIEKMPKKEKKWKYVGKQDLFDNTVVFIINRYKTKAIIVVMHLHVDVCLRTQKHMSVSMEQCC